MKSLAFAACLLAAGISPLEAEAPTPPFQTLSGAFFAVSVADMSESVKWYANKLGLSVVMESREGIEVTVLEGGGLLVELIRDPAARPLSVVAPGVTRPELVHGTFKAGFVVKDFEKTVEQLRVRGVTIAFGPFPANGRQKANLLIRDNSGNLIQIFGA